MIKKLLFFVLISSMFNSNIRSQIMIEDGKVWIAQSIGPLGDGDYALHICGDTMLNNMAYKKAYYVDIASNYYFGGFREVGNKVYFQPLQDPELLLYDFDLEIQDTFQLFILPGAPSIDFILESIQEEIIQDIEMEVYNFTNGQKWIRHIGSLASLYYIGFGITQYELGSYSENGNVLWCQGFFSQSCEEYYASIEDCFVTNTVQIDHQKELIFYPNPTSSNIILDLGFINNQDNLEISIWGVDQIRINHFQSSYSPQLEINLSHLPKGIYFISVENVKGHNFGTFKVIKK